MSKTAHLIAVFIQYLEGLIRRLGRHSPNLQRLSIPTRAFEKRQDGTREVARIATLDFSLVEFRSLAQWRADVSTTQKQLSYDESATRKYSLSRSAPCAHRHIACCARGTSITLRVFLCMSNGCPCSPAVNVAAVRLLVQSLDPLFSPASQSPSSYLSWKTTPRINTRASQK
jgi:hypothetical protein